MVVVPLWTTTILLSYEPSVAVMVVSAVMVRSATMMLKEVVAVSVTPEAFVTAARTEMTLFAAAPAGMV
jgi:hypothetical protein